MVDGLRVGYTITTGALDTPYKKILEDWNRRSKRFPCLCLVMHTVHGTASRCNQVLALSQTCSHALTPFETSSV